MPKKHKAVNPKSSENLLSKNKGSDISFESLNVHDQNAVLKKLELHAVEVYKERRKESNFLRKNLKKHSGSSPCAVPRLPGINKLNQKMTDYLNQILSTQDYEVDFSKVSRQGKKKSTPLASTTIREKKLVNPNYTIRNEDSPVNVKGLLRHLSQKKEQRLQSQHNRY